MSGVHGWGGIRSKLSHVDVIDGHSWRRSGSTVYVNSTILLKDRLLITDF
jgi:hypothetical protein